MGEVVAVDMIPEPTGSVPPAKVDASRPQWLPEKFKTPEDLAKSYTELEKKFSQANQKTPDPVVPPAVVPGEKTPPPVPTELGTADEAALAKAGLNINDLEAEFTKNGKLSEESAKKLAEVGIDQTKVEAYQRGRQAQSEDYEKAIVKDIRGGKEAFTEALKWASDNMSPEEIVSFDNVMVAGNAAVSALAATGLMARYHQAQGPQLIDGTPATNQADVYASRAQIHADMSDKRYKTDPAFRAKVEAKTLRSNPKH